MRLRVKMFPNPHRLGDGVSGIHTVVRSYARILPEFGIELVDVDDEADISVIHAGMGSHPCDVAMLHGIYFTADYKAHRSEWRANYHVVLGVRRASIVTVPSEWVAETLRRDFRLDPIILPHGIFPDDWKHSHKYAPKTVLWAKNRYYDVCDPTPLNSIALRLPDFRFFTTVAAPGAPANVMEIGVQSTEKMKGWVQKTSMVISTVKETWGILYAEALASGTPVVAANYGHAPSLVEHGVSGYVYDGQSMEDVEYGIRWVDKHRSQLSANASRLAGKLHWKHAGERIARTFRLAHKMRKNERLLQSH